MLLLLIRIAFKFTASHSLSTCLVNATGQLNPGPIDGRERKNLLQSAEMQAADGISTFTAAGGQHDQPSIFRLVCPPDRFSQSEGQPTLRRASRYARIKREPPTQQHRQPQGQPTMVPAEN